MADEATSTTTETATEEHEAPKTEVAGEKKEEKTTSGKTYDEAYVKELRQESAGYRTRLRDTETERDALKSEVEKLKGETSGASSRATDLERENTRLKVALDKGLPKELVSRLVGTTEEELAADADQLLALVAPSAGSTPRVGFDGGTRKGVEAPDLATQISEAEKAGDIRSAIALKAQMAIASRDTSKPGVPLTKS